MTFLFLTLYVHGRSENHWTRGILTGFLLYLTYATRSIGVIVAFALFIEGLIKKPKRWPYLLTAMAVLASGIVVENVYIPELSSYHSMFYFSIPRIIANVRGYASVLAYTVDNGYIPSLMTIGALFLFLLALGGFIKRMGKGPPRIAIGFEHKGCRKWFGGADGKPRRAQEWQRPFEHLRGEDGKAYGPLAAADCRIYRYSWGPDALDIFVLLYAGVTAVWPYFQTRYMVPLIPLVFFYAVYFLKDRFFLKKISFIYVFVGLVLTIYAVKYTSVDYGPLKEGITKTESVGLFAFVRTKTPSDAVIIFAKPRVLSLMTRRKSLALRLPASDSTILSSLKKFGVSFVIVSKWAPYDVKYLIPFIFHYKRMFRLIYKNGDFKVLKVIPGYPAMRTGFLKKNVP